MKADKVDWGEVGGQSSQASTYESKISKSSVFLPNALKQKQKSASKPTHIAPKISVFALRICDMWSEDFVHLTAPLPKFSGKVNNLSCLLLSTQNKPWVEGREGEAVLQELVKGSGLVYLMEKAIF